MIYTIEEISERVAPVAKKYKLPAVYLFGSYARGTAAETSDVDLIVDTAKTSVKGLFALGALYSELESALGKQIDLLTVDSLSQSAQMPAENRFRENIQKERVCIARTA